MPKHELFSDQHFVYTIGDASKGTEKWSPGEIVPMIADVPDALRQRYDRIMGEFWSIQNELKLLYERGLPADGTRGSDSV